MEATTAMAAGQEAQAPPQQAVPQAAAPQPQRPPQQSRQYKQREGGGAGQGEKPPEVNQSMPIPADRVGWIIGKQGVYIQVPCGLGRAASWRCVCSSSRADPRLPNSPRACVSARAVQSLYPTPRLRNLGGSGTTSTCKGRPGTWTGPRSSSTCASSSFAPLRRGPDSQMASELPEAAPGRRVTRIPSTMARRLTAISSQDFTTQHDPHPVPAGAAPKADTQPPAPDASSFRLKPFGFNPSVLPGLLATIACVIRIIQRIRWVFWRGEGPGGESGLRRRLAFKHESRR